MNTLRTLYSWFGSFRKPLALVFLLAGFAPRVAAQGNVWLWTYTFLSSQRPRISTDNQNLIYEQGIGLSCYKLRTKVLNVPGYPDGFHAATSWNNNNLPLDVLPPPATYAAQL